MCCDHLLMPVHIGVTDMPKQKAYRSSKLKRILDTAMMLYTCTWMSWITIDSTVHSEFKPHL